MVTIIQDLVEEFHNKYGLDIALMDDDIYEYGSDERIDRITEEYNELNTALVNLHDALGDNIYDETYVKKAHENVLKELCDLVYVLVGTAVAFDYDFDSAFDNVHESNMTKNGSVHDGKMHKGNSYVTPDLSDNIHWSDYDEDNDWDNEYNDWDDEDNDWDDENNDWVENYWSIPPTEVKDIVPFTLERPFIKFN